MDSLTLLTNQSLIEHVSTFSVNNPVINAYIVATPLNMFVIIYLAQILKYIEGPKNAHILKTLGECAQQC